jgi:hypothetical protein
MNCAYAFAAGVRSRGRRSIFKVKMLRMHPVKGGKKFILPDDSNKHTDRNFFPGNLTKN